MRIAQRHGRRKAAQAKGKASAAAEPGVFAIIRKRRKHLTDRAMLSLALRRNMSNVAARDLGRPQLGDISGQSTARCEELAGAATIAAARAFHASHDFWPAHHALSSGSRLQVASVLCTAISERSSCAGGARMREPASRAASGARVWSEGDIFVAQASSHAASADATSAHITCSVHHGLRGASCFHLARRPARMGSSKDLVGQRCCVAGTRRATWPVASHL